MPLSHRIQVGVLAVTGLVVFVMGLGVVFSVYSGNPMEANKILTSTITRKPAATKFSIESDGPVVHHKDKKMAQFNLRCLKAGKVLQLESQAKQMQISGRLCKGVELVSASVMNRSNSFEATTFMLKGNKFSTDYLYLVEGKNKIMVQLTDKNENKLATELVINRIVPKLTE